METNKTKNQTNKFLIGGAPVEIKSEWIDENKARVNRFRPNLIRQSALTKLKYYCSICLIIKDENEYLEEWLRWHIGQGVQHFYIYDNASKHPVLDFIETLCSSVASKVTVVDWGGTYKNAQPEAYNDCLRRFDTQSRWIGFIDADEQVRLRIGNSLQNFLMRYENFAGVMAMWKEYGANGQKNKSDLPLRKRFTKMSKHQSKLGKVFVQPLFMDSMYIHNGVPKEGFEVVDEYFLPMAELAIGKKSNVTTDFICVDHYYTKSYEEWIEKLKRGRCHLIHGRKYDEFFLYNPDMKYCKEDIEIKQEYAVYNKEEI